MSVAIVGKVIGGLLLSVGGTALIVIKVLPSFNADVPLDKNNPSKNIDIYAISEAGTDTVSVEINTADGQKNYKCKFGGKNYECTIAKTKDVDTAKKQANIDDLKEVVNTTITKDELKKEDKVYRITINTSTKDWSSNADAKIEMISTATGNDFGKKYASLKPLFALNSNDSINKHTKTKYFVVKSNSTAASDANSTYKCLEDKDCYVYDFSESSETNTNLHEISFKKPTTGTNSSITANKYYLVELKKEVKVEGVTNIKISNNSSNPAVDVVLDASVLIPAIRDKEDGDNIFILSTASKPTVSVASPSPLQ